MKNKTMYNNNTSGKPGVDRCYITGNEYWRVSIRHNNKNIQKVFSIAKLGDAEAKRQAIEKRKDLEVQFGYIGD
jgi:hypothetical protein